jgi:hypothetical protein
MVTKIYLFYSEQNSLLDHDISSELIYCNPPWSLAMGVEHLRACHSRAPLDTRAIIVLPDWPKFKAITKELKLIKQIPEGEKVCMRTNLTSTYDPIDLISTAWPINFLLMDASTPALSPLLNIDAKNVKPNVATNELKTEAVIKAEDEYLSTSASMVIMDPYKAEALLRFTARMSYNDVFSEANTLIDTAASLNFVSKEFVMAYGIYKECKTVLKLTI